ncbi:MAG: radical SAM protein, partial [Candidatus Omnitrophota bacterium]
YVPPPSNYRDLPTYGLLVQRGCPYPCVYCDSRIHGKKVRHDNLDKIISQIRYLVEKHGMKGILFHDSAFTINMDFAKKLCQRMIDERLNLSWTCYTRVDRVDPELLSLMKKAGCWGVAYGLESGNEESLKKIRKGVTLKQNIEGVRMTKKAGLQVIGSFIICLPGEDEKMAKNTIKFAKSLKLDTVVFFLPVPFPGTELYDICKKEGGLAENIQWQDYRQWMDQTNPLYVNPKIGREKMVKLYNYAVRSFYLSPSVILRFFSHIRSFSDFKKYLRGFKSISQIIKKSFINK